MASAILVFNGTVNKEHLSELKPYLGAMGSIFGEFKGRPMGRFKVEEALLGEANPDLVALIEFPDKASILSMMESPAFHALSEQRARVFRQINLSIASELG
jgi:uncharacterized protein (DUF1330 family)